MKVYALIFTGEYKYSMMSLHSTMDKANAAMAELLAKRTETSPDDYHIDEVDVD